MTYFKKEDISVLLLCLSILLYGSLSSPTPDNFSFVEFVIAVLLVCSVFFHFMFGVKRLHIFLSEKIYASVFILFYFFGLILAPDNDVRQVIRDAIAHIYFCLPVVYILKLRVVDIDRIAVSACLAGIMLAIRFAFESGFNLYLMSDQSFTYDGLLKLNTEPLIVFAEIYSVYRFSCDKNILIKILWMVAFSIPFAVLIASNMRGPVAMGLLAIGYVFFYSDSNRRYMFYSLLKRSIAIVAVVYAVFYLYSLGVFHGLESKMQLVGISNKTEEFIFLLSNIPDSAMFVFFGKGLGAWFDVGGRLLPFSHSLHMYYLYKSGIVVMIFVILLTIASIYDWFKCLGYNNVILFCLLPMWLYGTFLNPMYKFFGFGVCMLIFFASMRIQREHGG